MSVMRAKTVPTTRAVTTVTMVTIATMAGMVTIAKTVRTSTIAIMVTISRTVATSRTANVQNGYNGHDKFFVPRQTGKGLILPEDPFWWPTPERRWSIPGDAFPHPQLCRHTVCRELVWRTYTTAQALPTTKQVELFRAKEFATAVLLDHDKAFVARSWRPRMSPSQAPPSIRSIPMSSLQTLRRSYPSTHQHQQ